ncbi:galactosylgalactosylxylosylprotein 3-beta-glucuronosyltransferase 2-like [Alosa alosa]|uniref:galactosylgalactosylxylosylprotein 3-beta-glucuronosyltransferase 2-like n=1 Tax=Alosa alosa TaxID=278164 RepID=UPI00201505C1|nr:galactosylgalactosylxylosylprotein 3-beta-glucuronosyltransferase 2-like [Alosa alosa]
MTKFATRRSICIFLAWGLIMAVMLHLSVKETPPDIPVIYVITPTHTRPTQKADLTQLGNTLSQVPNLHWIVVEDADFKSPLVAKFLLNSQISYTHLNVSKPGYCKSGCVAKGSEQRNLGLDWLRRNRGPLDSGVVYFGDDDNTYDLELFEEMRYTKHVSVWPVGLIAARWYERPLVRDGRVVGWYTGFPGRRFGTDMAGFAVNLNLILANPEARFILKGARNGMQESDFLSKLTKLEYLEPKANNCTKVLVWHTRTEEAPLYKHVKENVDIEA